VKSRRVTEITVETNEIFTIRQGADSTRMHCPQCGPASAMVNPFEAAALFRVGIRAICREVEAGRVHFQESASGLLLICLDSLQKSALPRLVNSNLQTIQPQTNQSKENPS
jgi:hypothetical protein